MFVTISPKLTEEDNISKFNPEFRKVLLSITKSYFLLKIGVYPVDIVFQFRCKVSAVLCQTGCVQVMCNVLSEALKTRDFLESDGTMVNQFWFPVKNILLTLLSNSDCSKDIRLAIGQHPTLLNNMKQIVVDWQRSHLDDKLKVSQQLIS